MSAKDLDAMPELLSRKTVLQLTGWSRSKFNMICQNDPRLRSNAPGEQRRRVVKRRLLEILRLD